MPLTDTSLIARVVADDDRHAFAELVRRHQNAVRALLRRLTCGDTALADDLAQETFIRAYKGLARYRGQAKFSSWVYRIAYNVFLSERGRTKEELPGALPEGPDPAPSASRKTALKVDLQRAMIALSPAERAVITLAFAMEASHQEVAGILDCPLGTVKTHIMRGRQKLREQLESWNQQEYV